jgi:hypothetical protein
MQLATLEKTGYAGRLRVTVRVNTEANTTGIRAVYHSWALGHL